MNKLPKGFEGMMLYEKGGVVANPFTNKKAELNNIELSIYEAIKGAEMFEQWNIVENGIDWFKRNNAKAYMTLLD